MNIENNKHVPATPSLLNKSDIESLISDNSIDDGIDVIDPKISNYNIIKDKLPSSPNKKP